VQRWLHMSAVDLVLIASMQAVYLSHCVWPQAYNQARRFSLTANAKGSLSLPAQLSNRAISMQRCISVSVLSRPFQRSLDHLNLCCRARVFWAPSAELSPLSPRSQEDINSSRRNSELDSSSSSLGASKAWLPSSSIGKPFLCVDRHRHRSRKARLPL
jgi:hypothetical protein